MKTLTKEKPQINMLLRTALGGMKERNTLIGKQVKYIGDDFDKVLGYDYITKQLEVNKTYTIKSIVSGNYESFIYLENLPSERYSEYSRKVVPNSFNIKKFALVEA